MNLTDGIKKCFYSHAQNIHILDLVQSVQLLKEVNLCLESPTEQRKTFLFIGAKHQASSLISIPHQTVLKFLFLSLIIPCEDSGVTKINEDNFKNFLCNPEMIDADVLIRNSGCHK